MFFVLQCVAQKDNHLVLAKGQKITAVSTTSVDADMSMGMQMKNVSSTTNVLDVISEDAKNYTISNMLTKLKISMDAMGQQTNYDSEKPEDKDSEMGKVASKKINTRDTILIDKMTGDIIEDRKNNSPERADESNPLMGMMESMGNSDGSAVAEGAFFIISKEKKAGDTWTDSTSDKNIKTVKTYTIKSIDKSIATILVNGTISGDTVTEMQGSSVSFSMNTKSTGEMVVDIKTGLVNKITNTADITGNIEVMGQSMPITSKATSSVIYQH